MATGPNHKPSVVKKERNKKLLKGFAAASTAGLLLFGANEYRTEVYIPQQAVESAEEGNAAQFFEYLNHIDASRESESLASRAIVDYLEEHQTLEAEHIQDLLSIADTYAYVDALYGTLIILNDEALLEEAHTHRHRVHLDRYDINLDIASSIFTADVLAQKHAQTEYSQETLAMFYLLALDTGNEEVAQWVAENADLNSPRFMTTITDTLPNRSDLDIDYSDVFEGINLTSDNITLLSFAAPNNAELLSYLLDNYELEEEQLELLFRAISANSRSTSEVDLILTYYSPSEEVITNAFATIEQRQNSEAFFNYFATIFDVPQDAIDRRYLQFAESGNESRIIDVVPLVQDSEILAQGYITAAAEGNTDILFTLDVINIGLSQDAIDRAFMSAYQEGETHSLRYIAGEHAISPEVSRQVILGIIQNDRYYRSTEIAQELQDIIDERARNNPVITAPALPRP